MRILFISSHYDGGVGRHVTVLSSLLSNYGYNVSKMIIPHIPIKNYKNPSFALFSAIKSIIDWRKYDIVHAFNVPSAFAMKYTNATKRVISVHGVFQDQIKVLHSKPLSYISNKTEYRALNWADVRTTDSMASKNRYKELGFDFEYFPSPLDLTLFEKIPEVVKKKKQVAYVGRDSYEKGIDLLRKIEPDIKGDVVYCTDMPWEEAMKVLKSSTVTVLPSRYESLSSTIKEAFFFKVPVVATNVGGNPELITHGKTGYLVESENEKQLLDSINNILKDPDSTKIVTENAHKFLVENMTWDIILPKYIKFYNDLLK
ncbi:MAG: glycosyl transferase [Cenarchaeum symbiont of Oopsacas minuta]|nr:glycosyl transferase [Cenarchaeum symbiont of Oopsacas minuta]